MPGRLPRPQAKDRTRPKDRLQLEKRNSSTAQQLNGTTDSDAIDRRIERRENGVQRNR